MWGDEMELPETEMVQEYFLAKEDTAAGNFQDGTSCARDILDAFHSYTVEMEKLLEDRFIHFRQGVWYDTRTDLLLPEFDKGFCRFLTLEEFGSMTKGTEADVFAMEFAGLSGRCITAEECKALFGGKTDHYPHDPGRRQPNFIIDGQTIRGRCIYTKRSWNEKKLAEQGTARSVFFVGAGKSCYCVQGSGLLLERRGIEWLRCGNNAEKKAVFIPVCHLAPQARGDKDAKRRAVVCAILERGLVPVSMDEAAFKRMQEQYKGLKDCLSYDGKEWRLDVDAWQAAVKHGRAEKLRISTETIEKLLLECDTRRAALTPYPAEVLTNPNKGHWELYEEREFHDDDAVAVTLGKPLPARDPRQDIRQSGVCAIDFGTKSTVVVCMDREKRLIRAGRGDFTRAPSPSDYENPTVIELIDYASFHRRYQYREGRPFTEWEQVAVSQVARNDLLETTSQEIAQSIFGDLKQWANRRHGTILLRDQKQKDMDIWLRPYHEIGRADFDPIELYAYYLGLYINNMYNGIFLEYVMSFPVRYGSPVRKRLLDSFSRGLRKSLPNAVLKDEALMNRFCVYTGASEPAAYAVCALREMSGTGKMSRPEKKQGVSFAVFDFGGGTTDFDFGVWRRPAPGEGSYNDVIEHFGGESDLGLGGEKILDRMAYDVYLENLDRMRQEQIPFQLPEEVSPFDGAELLLGDSLEGRLNLRRLSDKLRPIWEEEEGFESMGDEEWNVKFFTSHGQCGTRLVIPVEKLRTTAARRIRHGVENFFCAFAQAFRDRELDECHILLAGNSSRSSLLQMAFEEALEQDSNWLAGVRPDGVRFYLHPPLGTDSGQHSYESVPTGKTGVAFGLLDCRRGGNDVLVLDDNETSEAMHRFRYMLGTADDRGNFRVIVPAETPYGEWKKFLRLPDHSFEVFYSAEPRARLGRVPVGEVRRKVCYLDARKREKEAWIYVRLKEPEVIEYMAATEEGMIAGRLLSDVQSCEL